MIDLDMDMVENGGKFTAFIRSQPILAAKASTMEDAAKKLLILVTEKYKRLDSYVGWVSMGGLAHMQIMRQGERYIACGRAFTAIPLKAKNEQKCGNCISYMDNKH